MTAPEKPPFSLRLRDYLWLVLLAVWMAALFIFCSFWAGGISSLALRLAIPVAGSLLAMLSVAALLNNSPRIRTYRVQASQLHAFCTAIKQASGTLELQEILDSAAKIIVEVTGVRGCSIKLLETSSGKMKARTVVGIEKDAIDHTLEVVENIYHTGMMAQQSIIVRDSLLRDFPSVDEAADSMICVPLHLEARVLGAICVFGERGRSLSPQMISLLASLGNVVSLAIAHAFVYDDLRKLVQTKTRFMFQTSHELRSPLNTIQTIARTLLEGHLGELSPEQREMITRIDTRAKMLSEIVGDLLVLAMGRAELSTLMPKPVDLVGLLQEAVKFFELRAIEKAITMVVNCRLPVAAIRGSEEGLRSVVTNLLANAIKYTPDGGKVTLNLFESKEQLVLEVIDTGIGIPQEEQENLFKEFFRASNARSVSQVGTGLGLTIVKAAVDQHGGSIDVESTEGKGTTFRIFLNKAER